jgi:uncharacterized CHY-type Zn-finger protein
VAGRCYFTLDNYKDFSIMMRTTEESENLNLPPNSEFDWPDVRSLLLCPLCSAMAQIPDGTECEYWMIFYPLLQVEHQGESEMTLATRTICRLVCLDCMQQLLDGLFLTVKQTEKQNAVAFSLSAMEILQEAGTVSFLQDGPPRPAEYAHVDDPIDAWTVSESIVWLFSKSGIQTGTYNITFPQTQLYTLWESTGAWEALQNDYRSALARSMMSSPPTPPRKKHEFMTKDRYGKKCGNEGCVKMHGKTDSDGAIIRLSVICKQCKLSYYCSNECRSAAFAAHSLECESNKKKAKLVLCDACKKTLPYTRMKKCSRCRKAVYCSVECQRSAWSTHKVTCHA